MAPVKFARIVSYSSEDPIHKADNLLNPQSTKKWKCKTMGEKQAIAILQLSRQVQINAVDIGNEYSAFVEVFAAKSSNPDEYKMCISKYSKVSFCTKFERKNCHQRLDI
uniref:DNA repair protein XRCC1 n=1 Tax=Cacopsylla melanoneura TaxID=428564 RepID=A0A8D9FJF3_9HEMI